MDRQTAITLPEQTYMRLQALVQSTGKSASFHICAAIEEHLEDMEDISRAEQVLARVRSGQEVTSSLNEVEKRLGLAD